MDIYIVEESDLIYDEYYETYSAVFKPGAWNRQFFLDKKEAEDAMKVCVKKIVSGGNVHGINLFDLPGMCRDSAEKYESFQKLIREILQEQMETREELDWLREEIKLEGATLPDGWECSELVDWQDLKIEQKIALCESVGLILARVSTLSSDGEDGTVVP